MATNLYSAPKPVAIPRCTRCEGTGWHRWEKSMEMYGGKTATFAERCDVCFGTGYVHPVVDSKTAAAGGN